MCYLWGAFIGAIALLTAGHLWEVRTCIALRNAYGYQALLICNTPINHKQKCAVHYNI
jgi:hypothetical protein